jgi:hypothetical protein
MTKDEALDLALEALEMYVMETDSDFQREAITAIKQARSAPVQEPVHQWQKKHSPYWYDGYPDNDDGGGPYETRTLYTTPPAAQRQWVGLTVEQMFEAIRPLYSSDKVAWLAVNHSKDEYRAIEAKLKEKNT